MPFRAPVGGRSLATAVLSLATAVLVAAMIIACMASADPETAADVPAPLLCPKYYSLAENNLVCTRRVEAGVNMTVLEARRVCQAHGYDLAGPDATRIANCTAASPCWLGMRCSARRRVERDGDTVWEVAENKLGDLKKGKYKVTCRSIGSDNDDPAIPESTNWAYGALTPDNVLKQGGCVLLVDGRWHLASCNPGDDGLASVPSVVPLCEARPTPRTLTELQAGEAGLVGTAELNHRDQRTNSTSANTFGVVVDLEELVRNCAGGRDTDKCQAFLYGWDSEKLQSINGRRSNGMHRIHVRGERNSNKAFLTNLLYGMFLQHGDNSHTRGISAAWPGPDGKPNAVLLDTAGTNQPVNQSDCMNMSCTASKIRQRRVSDKFVLDVAHAIADKPVVNRMSAASVERINELIQKDLFTGNPGDALESMHKRVPSKKWSAP